MRLTIKNKKRLYLKKKITFKAIFCLERVLGLKNSCYDASRFSICNLFDSFLAPIQLLTVLCFALLGPQISDENKVPASVPLHLRPVKIRLIYRTFRILQFGPSIENAEHADCLSCHMENRVVIFFSLTEAPLPDPTPAPPNTPKRT